MTTKKELDSRGIIRRLLDSEIPLSERAAALLVRLATDGAPAGSRPDHPQLAAALGSLYRPSVLISYYSQDKIGQRLRWGQAEAGKQRTPEQVRKARAEAVRRTQKELISLGLLIVLKNAGISSRADRKSNLYALDLERCEQLTTPQQHGLVVDNDPSQVRVRSAERPLTGEDNDPSQVRDKDREKDQTLSLSETSSSTSSEEREMLSALIDAGYLSKVTPAGRHTARELLSLEATPEQVMTSRQTWREMGRTFSLGLEALLRHWPVIAAEQRLKLKLEEPLPAMTSRYTDPRLCALCGGPRTYSREGDGTYLCAKMHSGNPHEQPSEEWLKENHLEPV